MNTQNHVTLKATPYEVVFGLKPSSEPVQDLMITEQSTDDDSCNSEDDEHDTHNISFGCGVKTDDEEIFPLQNESIVAS